MFIQVLADLTCKCKQEKEQIRLKNTDQQQQKQTAKGQRFCMSSPQENKLITKIERLFLSLEVAG